MGLLSKKKKGVRRRILSWILPLSKTDLPTEDTTIASSRSESRSPTRKPKKKGSWNLEKSPILRLPTELLRSIFAQSTNTTLQALYNTHPRFRSIIAEHRSYLCKELGVRDLRYFARYLNPAWFTYQQESIALIFPALVKSKGKSHGNTNSKTSLVAESASISSWYLTLYKLDKITKEFFALMPLSEKNYENEYRRIQGLAPLDSPPIWPRPGWANFYFTHTIIAFYQYNSVLRISSESQEQFRKRGIKSVCRSPQGYFRSTAHLGMLCAVYMACLKYQTDGAGKIRKKERDILAPYLPELGGCIGNYIADTLITVKELFKMVIVVTYPGNLVKVIKEPTFETMRKFEVVLRTVRDILVNMEAERRSQGDDRWYAKGQEMTQGFALHWQKQVDDEEKAKLRYFRDWDEMTDRF